MRTLYRCDNDACGAEKFSETDLNNFGACKVCITGLLRRALAPTMDFSAIAKVMPRMTEAQEAAYLADRERRRVESEHKRAERRTLAFENGLPPALRWAKVDAAELGTRCSVANPGAWAKANWQAKRVVFVGPAGAGKSSLAVAMLRWAFEAGRSACFSAAHRLGTIRIQTAAGLGEPEYIAKALAADVTLIDDLGIEKMTQNNAVPDVIIDRHLEDRATWVTTGLSSEQIAQRYGDGVRRRIYEGAVGIRLGAKSG